MKDIGKLEKILLEKNGTRFENDLDYRLENFDAFDQNEVIQELFDNDQEAFSQNIVDVSNVIDLPFSIVHDCSFTNFKRKQCKR